jgi:hypothetical protein
MTIKNIKLSGDEPFKGTVARDLRPSGFFYQSTPLRALIHRLKRFAYGFVFAQIIASKVVKIGNETENEVKYFPPFFCLKLR